MEIKYYNNPLSDSEYQETKAETIKEAMENLGISDKPLCVIINGKIPDDIDLDKKIRSGDIVEFRHVVEGSNSNETWANIINVAATVAALYLTAGGYSAFLVAAVAIGGSLAAGAILAAAPLPTNKSQFSQDLEVENNNLSLSQASNQVRIGDPIPVVIGSLVMAPDVYSYPYYLSPFMGDIITVTDDYVKVSAEETAYLYSSQIFSFGFGDFDISERRIGGYVIPDMDGDLAGYSRILFPSQFTDADEIPASSPPFVAGIFYVPIVNRKKEITLTNTVDSILYVDPDDLAARSWTIFEGGLGQANCAIEITGNLYQVSGGAYSNLSTYVQIQRKRNVDTDWTDLSPGRVFWIENASSKRIVVGIATGDSINLNESLMIRIRKAQNDSVDNTTSKVARLSASVTFLSNTDADKESRLPINLDGLYVTSSLSAESSTNEYRAKVEAKCYVFDGEEWSWEHTRNPAWWFLYFARGGFLNKNSNGDTKEFPLSPTNTWQNYKLDSNNEELMWGGGYSHSEIDIEKIKEWALFCDANGLNIDLIIRDDVSVSETLEKIAKVGRASIFFNSEKLSVVFEDKNQLPVAAFGMANIKANTFKVDYQSQNLYHKVVCTFSDRNSNFESKEVTALIPFSTAEETSVVKVTLSGVTGQDQAQRECNLIAARQYFQSKTYSWESDHEGFLAKRGDVVYLSHDATQYGYSGRVAEFILDGSVVKGIRTTANLGEFIEFILMRLPNGEMKKYRAQVEAGYIYFIDSFSIEDAPYVIKNKKRDFENDMSRFSDSIAEDYTFIADIKNTTGKIVRIASVEQTEENGFNYTAVDEDPALWAFELGFLEDSNSLNDSIGKIEVYDVSFVDLGSGAVKILWNGSDDCLFFVINMATGMPIDINGRFSISEKEVTLLLSEKTNYHFRITPISIDNKVVSKSEEVKFWLN